MATHKITATLPAPRGSSSTEVSSVVFSPNGTTLDAADQNDGASLWNVQGHAS